MTQTLQPDSFPYELKSFPSRLVDGELPAEVAAWTQAVSLGFHGGSPTPETIKAFVSHEQVDGRIVTGAYPKVAPALAGAWGPERPVATYAYHRKDLNVGNGTLLPVHQITAVTVRSTHRRRGLLRAMITSDLAQAKADGLPMAALTASEATIYGRFGFGAATHVCTVEVATKNGITFHNRAAASVGTVEIADPTVVSDIHNDLFARIHATSYGSIGRHDFYRLTAAGQGSYESVEPDNKVRAALHYDANGIVDGYVSYKPQEPKLEIVDLLAATPEAYLALWDFLGSVDLIESITWKHAPAVDPLEWAMSAKRDYKRTETEDHLWLRILDTVVALEAKSYASDGAVVIAVADPLAHAAGTFRVDVTNGKAQVTALPSTDSAELELGVSELSSLYLGVVSAQTLHSAGRVKENSPGAVARFDAIFAPLEAAHSFTDF